MLQNGHTFQLETQDEKFLIGNDRWKRKRMETKIIESFSFEESLGAHLLQLLLEVEMAVRLNQLSQAFVYWGLEYVQTNV